MAREHPEIPLSEYRKREKALLAKQGQPAPPHDCFENAVYCETDGPLGQAYYCNVCGAFLQAG